MRKERGPRNPRAGMKQTRFSCTPEEYSIIQAEAQHAKMSVNEYVRKRALGKPILNADRWLILAQLRAIHRDLWGWRYDREIMLDFPTHTTITQTAAQVRKALADIALSMHHEERGEPDANHQENSVPRGESAD